MFDVYAITPERPAEDIARKTATILAEVPRGALAVQLRARHLPRSELLALGHELRALTRERGARLLVSADVELAGELGADGVQLPERGESVASARARMGPAALIGASRHALAGASAAAAEGASFVLLGPVFRVPGKGEPLGLEGFAAIATRCSVPVIALGGVTPANAPALVARGARGVAAIRSLFDDTSSAHTARALCDAVRSARRTPSG